MRIGTTTNSVRGTYYGRNRLHSTKLSKNRLKMAMLKNNTTLELPWVKCNSWKWVVFLFRLVRFSYNVKYDKQYNMNWWQAQNTQKKKRKKKKKKLNKVGAKLKIPPSKIQLFMYCSNLNSFFLQPCTLIIWVRIFIKLF